jgi:hypothetical protein
MSIHLGLVFGAIFLGVILHLQWLAGISWWPTHPLQRRFNASASPLDTPLAIAALLHFFPFHVIYLDND